MEKFPGPQLNPFQYPEKVPIVVFGAQGFHNPAANKAKGCLLGLEYYHRALNSKKLNLNPVVLW